MTTDALRRSYLVLVPTFCNAGTIKKVVVQISEQGFCCVVVDDGSETPVEPLLRDAQSSGQVIVNRFPKNRGKGEALKYGFSFARARGYTHVIVMDGDGQHDPKDLIAMITASQQSPRSLVFGVRDFESCPNPVPVSSRFGRSFSNMWIYLETGQRLRDSQTGFRCYPLNGLQDPLCGSSRYDFEIEVVVRWLWQGGAIAEEEIGVQYPEDRVSSFRAVVDNTRLSALHTKLCMLRMVGAGWLWSFGGKASPEIKGVRFTQQLLRLLGPRICYLLLPIIAAVYWLILAPARRGLKGFYHRLGNHNHNTGSFWNVLFFSYSVLDRLILATLGRRPRIETGVINIRSELRGCTLLGAHYGDWTFAGSEFADLSDRELLVVMDREINPAIQGLMKNNISKNVRFADISNDPISVILACRQTQRFGGFVCLMADRAPKTSAGDWAKVAFLGTDLNLHLGVFELALALKSPVIFFSCVRMKVGSKPEYRLNATEVWDGVSQCNPRELAAAYLRALETTVKHDPRHWFNFFDYWRSTDGGQNHTICQKDQDRPLAFS